MRHKWQIFKTMNIKTGYSQSSRNVSDGGTSQCMVTCLSEQCRLMPWLVVLRIHVATAELVANSETISFFPGCHWTNGSRKAWRLEWSVETDIVLNVLLHASNGLVGVLFLRLPALRIVEILEKDWPRIEWRLLIRFLIRDSRPWLRGARAAVSIQQLSVLALFVFDTGDRVRLS